MNDLSNRSTPQLMLDLVLEGFRIRDDKLNALASEICARCGDQAIRRLVVEAVSRKNRLEHRVRLLRAIQRIGTTLDISSWMDLFTLTSDKNSKVRDAAVRLIVSLRGCHGERKVDVDREHGISSPGVPVIGRPASGFQVRDNGHGW